MKTNVKVMSNVYPLGALGPCYDLDFIKMIRCKQALKKALKQNFGCDDDRRLVQMMRSRGFPAFLVDLLDKDLSCPNLSHDLGIEEYPYGPVKSGADIKVVCRCLHDECASFNACINAN